MIESDFELERQGVMTSINKHRRFNSTKLSNCYYERVMTPLNASVTKQFEPFRGSVGVQDIH